MDKCLRLSLERQEQDGQQKKEKYGSPAGIKRPTAGNLPGFFCVRLFNKYLL